MISVVCVYNDERALRRALLMGLANQTVEFELIALDNRDGKYGSAAEALNSAGSRAKGDFIMFVHQDVWLGSESWLERIEKALSSIADLGVAGGAGMREEGSNYDERVVWAIDTFHKASWVDRGREITQPVEVQTLDEFLLIVPRSVFARLQFDERTFDGWHCYGADYCLSVRRLGLKAYVVPAFPCRHSSAGTNWKDLPKYQRRLHGKHKATHPRIHTHLGETSWLSLRIELFKRIVGPFCRRWFPEYSTLLARELRGCSQVLELGCGWNSMMKRFEVAHAVGVDSFRPHLEESRRRGLHGEHVMADPRKLHFKPGSFDAVIAVNLLQRLSESEGGELLSRMEQWARRKVVVTVGNGPIGRGPHERADSHPRAQMVGWSVRELRGLGFKVRGAQGWRALRLGDGSVRYRPAFLWGRISELTQAVAYYWPQIAFELVAVKNKDRR